MKLLIPLFLFLNSCFPSKNETNKIVNDALEDVEFNIVLRKGESVHYYYIENVHKEISFFYTAPSDTVLNNKISTNSPIEINFNYLNETVNYLFFPGDRITINITNGKYASLSSSDIIRQNELEYQKAEWAFIKEVFYISPNKKYSDNFNFVIKEKEKIEAELLNSKNENKISEKFFESMKVMLASFTITSLLYPTYSKQSVSSIYDVNNIKLEEIMIVNDSYLSCYSYRNALWNYLKYLTHLKINDPQPEDFCHFVSPKFKGSSKDYLFARIVHESINKGKIDSILLSNILNKTTSEFYKNYIADNLNIENVENGQFINLEGNVFDIDSLFNANKDTLIYIDFWASWCSPCKEELKYYPELIQHFENEKIKFLFVSLDKDYSSWKSQAEDFLFMSSNNSFLLGGNFDSKLAKSLKIDAIPRYVIIKNGKFLNKDAFRPSSKEFKHLIKEF